MNTATPLTSVLLASTALATHGCGELPPPPAGSPQEIITTLNASLTPVGGGAALVMSIADVDHR